MRGARRFTAAKPRLLGVRRMQSRTRSAHARRLASGCSASRGRRLPGEPWSSSATPVPMATGTTAVDAGSVQLVLEGTDTDLPLSIALGLSNFPHSRTVELGDGRQTHSRRRGAARPGGPRVVRGTGSDRSAEAAPEMTFAKPPQPEVVAVGAEPVETQAPTARFRAFPPSIPRRGPGGRPVHPRRPIHCTRAEHRSRRAASDRRECPTATHSSCRWAVSASASRTASGAN